MQPHVVCYSMHARGCSYNSSTNCNMSPDAGLRSEHLHERLISLSSDTVAIVDLAEKSRGNCESADRLCVVCKHTSFCC